MSRVAFLAKMKRMHRMPTRKSHSWWWDSHISPKNSKWLTENLEEMDKQVKDMLRLIEDEGDSFAKKAEMYFERRPLLVTRVENFYRMYRALAERYDNVTGELRKNIPSSLQSQGSLCISESDSETQSTPPTPEPTPKQKHKTRAVSFDAFLGSAGSSEVSKKRSDGSSSSSESDSEVDEAREENGDGSPFALYERIAELEDELQEAREKLEALEEKNARCWCEKLEEKLKDSHSEINSLKKELEEKVQSLESYKEMNSGKENLEAAVLANKNEIEKCKKHYEGQLAYRDHEIKKCKKELEQVYEKYSHDKSTLETEIRKLQDVVKNVEGDLAKISQEKLQLEAQVKELERASHSLVDTSAKVMKLQEIIKDLQTRLDNDSNEKRLLEERAIEFEQVRRELEGSRTEVTELQASINNLKADLGRALQEKSQLESRIKDLEQAVACNLEEFSLDKSSLGAEIQKLTEANASLEGKLTSTEAQLRQLHAEKSEASIDSEKQISDLNQDIADLKTKLELLSSEKAAVDDKVCSLLTDVTARDEKIREMDSHLHLEHVKLIAEADATKKAVSELRSRVRELEEEVEKQKLMVSDGAEGKREAIRQLCFSLEHYRHGYQQLRQLLQGHKRPMVMVA